MILKCNCEHKFQDRTYGPKLRVHNSLSIKSGSPEFRCTVCGNVKKKEFHQTTTPNSSLK